MIEDRNDMAYWFPRLKATGVPVPETTIIHADGSLREVCDGSTPASYNRLCLAIGMVAEEYGYPCFLRTGHTSGKHSWRETCFLQESTDIPQHVYNLIEFSEMADILGLPYKTWAVRRFVPLVSHFTAFDGMPVAVERRVFIRDGRRSCDHPYWPPASIRNPSREDWQRLLADHDEVARLYDTQVQIRAALDRICSAFDGYWSVDFALGRDGVWYAIDMAQGDRSWHWPGCRNVPEDSEARH
jgi:hypothetical protein